MVTRIDSSSTSVTKGTLENLGGWVPEAYCQVREAAATTVLVSELPLSCVPAIAAALEHQGARVLVPGSIISEGLRQGCLLITGTRAQFAAAEAAMFVQSPDCSTSIAELRLFAELALSYAPLDAIGSKRPFAIGGLIDCDVKPPGVRDCPGNATGRAWNLLENGSDFLVLTSLSSPVALQKLAGSLTAVSTCPVSVWLQNGDTIFSTMPTPPVIGSPGGIPADRSVAFAMWRPHSPGELMTALVHARADARRVLVTAEVPAVLAGISGGVWKWPSGLPRLDAAVLGPGWLSGIQPAVLAGTMARLFERGTRVFITERPEVITKVLDEVLTAGL